MDPCLMREAADDDDVQQTEKAIINPTNGIKPGYVCAKCPTIAYLHIITTNNNNHQTTTS
jgi:hypothetical protein